MTNDELLAAIERNARALNTLMVDIVGPISESLADSERRSRNNETLFQNLLEESREDRKRADEDRKRADEDRKRADEDRKRADRQFQALIAQANQDRIENRRRFDSQQQAIQTLLVFMSDVNSRVERLEAS